MNSLNRNIAPKLSAIPRVDIPRIQSQEWENGIKLHHLKAGSEDVVRMEIIIRAGTFYSDKILVPPLLAKLSREGTLSFSADKINEELDFIGASLNISSSSDFIILTIYSLSKHLSSIIPLLKEILCVPLLKEKSLSIITDKEKSGLNISNKKNDFVARNTLDQNLYGDTHPFGYYPNIKDIESLRVDDLIKYHKKQVLKYPWEIIISGQFNDTLLKELHNNFVDLNFDHKNFLRKNILVKESRERNIHKTLKGSKQAAIAIGQLCPRRNHPDFPGIKFLNTILGGFFGSRLMKNLREEKGFTYGVFSSARSLPLNGQWGIYTEVGVDIYESALNEIYHEIKRLNNDKVGKEELEIVKNYISGSFLSTLDGPFSLADRFKSIYFSGLGYDYFDYFLEETNSMTPNKLQSLANKYLFNSYHEVVIA